MYITLATESVIDRDARLRRQKTKQNPEIMDFFEARHQLMLGETHSNQPTKHPSPDPKLSGRMEPSSGRAGMAEQALYWLISAPALAYLFYLAFGL
jgi:hypothetical protein